MVEHSPKILTKEEKNTTTPYRAFVRAENALLLNI